MKAPRDLVFMESVDVRFNAAVDVERALRQLKEAQATGAPVRIAGATRRLENARTVERQAKARLDAAFTDAAKESA